MDVLTADIEEKDRINPACVSTSGCVQHRGVTGNFEETTGIQKQAASIIKVMKASTSLKRVNNLPTRSRFLTAKPFVTSHHHCLSYASSSPAERPQAP